MKWHNHIIATTVVMTLLGCSEKSVNGTQNKAPVALVATGELVSTNTVTVSPPSVSQMWQYKIQYLAPENAKVKKGDLVVRFDPQQLREELMSRQSELAAATKEKEQKRLEQEQEEQDLKLSLAEAKMTFEKEQRKAEIVDEGLSRIQRLKQQKTFEIAKLRYQQVQQKIDNFKQETEVNRVVTDAKITRLTMLVDQIKADINKLNVQASKEGIVMYVKDHNGEKPAVGDNLWMGRRVLTIPSLDEIAIKAQFDEPDTTSVAVNSKVKITLEAFPEVPFMGEISSLGQSYKTKSPQNPKTVFDVLIKLDDVDSSLMRPGMKAKVELVNDLIAMEQHGSD